MKINEKWRAENLGAKLPVEKVVDIIKKYKVLVNNWHG